jgi:archaellum component FlaC
MEQDLGFWQLVLKIGPYLLGAAGAMFGIIMKKYLGKADEKLNELVTEVSDVLREALDVIPALDAAIDSPTPETFEQAKKEIEEFVSELKDVVAYFGRD